MKEWFSNPFLWVGYALAAVFGGLLILGWLFHLVVAVAIGIGGSIWAYASAKRAYNSPRMAMSWAIAFFFGFPLSLWLYDEIRPQPRGAI